MNVVLGVLAGWASLLGAGVWWGYRLSQRPKPPTQLPPVAWWACGGCDACGELRCGASQAETAAYYDAVTAHTAATGHRVVYV